MFSSDLDGDGNDELIRFKIDFHGYWLTVFKHGVGIQLQFPEDWAFPFNGEENGLGTLQVARTIHLAIKDVTNDGMPELLVAAHDGYIGLRIAVWGFRNGTRRFEAESWGVVGTFDGQTAAHVFNGGHIVLPYGTAGLFNRLKWDGSQFASVPH